MTYTAWTKSPMYELGPVGFSTEGFLVFTYNIVGGVTLVLAAVLWSKGKGWQAFAIMVGVTAAYYVADAVGVFPN